MVSVGCMVEGEALWYRVWALLNVSWRELQTHESVGDGQQGQLALRRRQRHRQRSRVASAEVNEYDSELGLHELHVTKSGIGGTAAVRRCRPEHRCGWKYAIDSRRNENGLMQLFSETQIK